MRNPRDLIIFTVAFQLSIEVERALRDEEVSWPVANQLRRSINSVADNIAEGCAFDSDKVLRRHCAIALGSLFESEVQLERLFVLADFGPNRRELQSDLIGLKQKLIAFIRHLDRKNHSPRSP